MEYEDNNLFDANIEAEEKKEADKEHEFIDRLHEKYLSKNCKFHPLPETTNSMVYTDSLDREYYIGDVFGMGTKEHFIKLPTGKYPVLLSLSIEVSHHSSATITVDIYKEEGYTVNKAPVIAGQVTEGAGGSMAKAWVRSGL